MNKATLKDHRGFSLVELMVVLSLLGVVLALGYMFFDFGARAFNRGERQSIAQQGIRVTSDFITTELRYASQIELYNSDNRPTESGFYYIYQNGDSLYYRSADDSINTLLNSTADQIDYALSFEENINSTSGANPNLILNYFISADGNLYNLESSIHVLNLINYSNYQDLSGVQKATAVRYKKPWVD